jgi:hypothetical protein
MTAIVPASRKCGHPQPLYREKKAPDKPRPSQTIPFPLAPPQWQVYRQLAMVRLSLFAAIALLTSASCQKRSEEVTVTETRTVTTRDSAPKLNATSDERFRDARPAPVLAETPDGWLLLPATQMRLLNYRFGESGLGEAYVSLSSGSVLENANRWFKQFGQKPLDQAGFESLPRVPIAGVQGVLIQSTGTYASGMGAPARAGYGLAGIIAGIEGQILTVKMVGPDAEVREATRTLQAYAAAMKWRAATPPSDD